MAQDHEAATQAQGVTDTSPALPPDGSSASPPSVPALNQGEKVAYGWLITNGVLLLVLGFEAGVLLMGRSVFLSRLALFASVVALVQTIFNVVFQFVAEKFRRRMLAILQRPLLTWVLIGIALLVAYPSWAATMMILRPPPLVRILPGNGVFNLVAQAVKGQGISYVLQVKQGGKILGTEDVTGAGSVEAGKDPRSQVEAIDDSLKTRQRAEMEGYLQSNAPAIVTKWTDPGSRRFVTAPLERGCTQLELTYQAGAVQELISRQWVRIDSKVQLVFLEAKIENQGCGV